LRGAFWLFHVKETSHWISESKENGRRENIGAAAVARRSLFAGLAPADFRSAMGAWRRICGD
jgi:hypothetical protein